MRLELEKQNWALGGDGGLRPLPVGVKMPDPFEEWAKDNVEPTDERGNSRTLQQMEARMREARDALKAEAELVTRIPRDGWKPEPKGFEIGDVVLLRSGGPLMTVSMPLNNGEYEVTWFAGTEVRRHTFDGKELKPK